MPNAVKYKTGNLTGSLQKGNVALGISGSLGPTSTTGWYNGPNPVAGKYQIFETAASGDPDVYSPQNDAELIRFARWKGATGADTGSAAAVLAWIGTQTNLMAANFEYESIVTNGLVFNTDAGFVGSYPTTSSTWYDISGNSNNGTLTNGPTFSSANSGSIVFDGVDDYVSTNYSSIIGTNPRTFSVWFKPNGYQNRNLLGYGTQGDHLMWDIILYGGDVGVHLYNSGAEAGTSYTDGVWQNITFTYTHPTIKSYMNGVYKNSYTSSKINTGNDTPLNIAKGTYAPYFYFNGNISTTQIYNRELSATEVLQNYNALKGRFGL